ncbi:MAG: adenylyl-sulfate kinase [Elusimicrobia bacterium]|nr:adenylyl-sulfate kinase [Elusimicrobiota bacterium]
MNPPKAGAVVWFTGLSGSGKSTLAKRLCARLRRSGRAAELLDGDVLRARAPKTGFTKAARDRHVRRTGRLAAALERRGIVAVAALISPYAAARRYVRGLCRNFMEIHVATTLSVCRRRDPKGLYARAARGELARLTGVDDPYQAPRSPELRIDGARLSEAKAAAAVIKLVTRRLLPHGPSRKA